MKGLSQILDKGSKLVDSVGNAFDKNFSNKEEILNAKGEILAQINSFLTFVTGAQKEIISAEIKGNWLQRSWRPIVMLAFAFVVVYAYFIQPAFFPNSVAVSAQLPSDFWGLLKLGFTGYIVGRSVEKTAGSISGLFNKNKS